VDRRRLLTIFGIVLIDMLGFSIVLPLLPYYARTFGASDLAVGLMYAAYPAAQLIGAPILGRWSDRYGRRPIQLLSILGTFAGFLVLGFASALWMLFASRVMDGSTGGNISVAQAYISDVSDERSRGKALGIIGAAFGIGFILGPVSGGLLSRFGFAVPAFFAAALTALNLLAVYVLLPESLTAENRARLVEGPRRPALDLRAIGEALAHPRVGPLMWLRLDTGLAFSMFETGFSLWALRRLGLTAEQNGLVLGYVGVLSVIIQGLIIGWLTKRVPDARLITASVALTGVSLVAWSLSPNAVVLLVVMVPLSLGMAVANTVGQSALSKAVYPEEVGGVFGLSASLLSLTRIPAPVIAALLIDRIGTWSPGIAAGALVLAAVPYVYRRFVADPAPPLPPRGDVGMDRAEV
jgi:DHA1 family tetracycline resistance protein-like MFS transporter